MRTIWSFCKVHGYLHLNPSIIHPNIMSQTLQDNLIIFLFLDSSSKHQCIGPTTTPCRRISALPRHHISPPTKGRFHHPPPVHKGWNLTLTAPNGQIICDYPSMLIFQISPIAKSATMHTIINQNTESPNPHLVHQNTKSTNQRERETWLLHFI